MAGPAALIAAWAILGSKQPGYSPINDPISQLAAVGAPSRAVMTCGFIAFGVGVSLYATEIGSVLPGGVALAAATTAAATIGIAVLPLGSPLGDSPHGAAAVVAYAALALTPLLGARSLARRNHRGAATASVAIGVGCGAALVASIVVRQHVGLWQRAGLTIGDVWIIGTALWVAAGAGRQGR